MTPEQRQIKELQRQVKELTNFVQSLKNAAQTDPQVAFTITKLLSSTSSKTAASATQAVNEAGASSYSVMKAPNGFISIGGKNVPYIN